MTRARSALFHVIAASSDGTVHELDLHAPDAPSAVVIADAEIREQQPNAILTHIHARHMAGYVDDAHGDYYRQ